LQPVPGQHVNTLLNQVSPGIFANLGNQWSLDYTPTLRFYSDKRFQDGVDHAVSLVGRATYQDWIFGFQQGYASSSQPLVETGSQTDQENYTTALTAVYTMSSKMSLDFNANQNFRYVSQQFAFQPLTDSKQWSTMEWLNYQFGTGLSAGIGAGFTYDNLQIGSDMTSEQFQGRVNWRPTPKLTFSLSGGLDDRQFVSSREPDLLSPIFSASAQYQLFQQTSLSLAASETTSPAYFQGELNDATTISAGLRQRLLGTLFLDVSGGYSTTSYHATSTAPGSAPANNFETTSLNVRLSSLLFRRVNAAVFFQETFVSSSSAGTAASNLYNYTTTQGGFSLGYRF
jgi:ribosome-binding factor A